MKAARLRPESSPTTAGAGRRWEDLSRDILVTIFAYLGVDDLIAGVPFACSSWRDAARDPSCWRDLDFRDWESISSRLGCSRAAPVDFCNLLGFCIARSGEEFVDSVHFPCFADEVDLEFVAERCPELLYFSFQSAEIPADKFCDAISKFEFLEGMEVDESLINDEVLQRVNQCCMSFSELKVFAYDMHQKMATIICKWLPHLRKLEAPGCYIKREVIITFLDELKELEYLDISGLENAGIMGVVLEKASHLKVFLWDSKYDVGECLYCSECNQDWLDHDHCMCAVDHNVPMSEWAEFYEHS